MPSTERAPARTPAGIHTMDDRTAASHVGMGSRTLPGCSGWGRVSEWSGTVIQFSTARPRRQGGPQGLAGLLLLLVFCLNHLDYLRDGWVPEGSPRQSQKRGLADMMRGAHRPDLAGLNRVSAGPKRGESGIPGPADVTQSGAV